VRGPDAAERPIPDKIIVQAIDCSAAIGVSSEERAMKQRLSVDVEVSTDTRAAARTDSLRDTLDYGVIAGLVVELAGRREYHLLETLAEAIAGRVLADCGGDQVRVLVRKMHPPLEERVAFVGVEIVRRRGENV